MRFALELAGGLEHGAQPGFDIGQALRVQFDPADVVVQVGDGFGDRDAGRFEFVADALQGGVVAQHLLQLVGGAIEAVLGRVVLAVQRLEDARGPVQQRLGVRQPGVLGLQRIPFVRTQPQAVQFVRLPLQAVAFGGQRLGVLLGGIELAGQRAPLLQACATVWRSSACPPWASSRSRWASGRIRLWWACWPWMSTSPSPSSRNWAIVAGMPLM